MEQTELSISGENHSVQVGTNNLLLRSDAPIEVEQISDDDDDDEGWTEVPQRPGQPGVPQLPHADHSAPDVDISDAGPHRVSQMAAIRIPTEASFPQKITISGKNHNIQHGGTCTKVLSPPFVPGMMQSPPSQAIPLPYRATASLEPRTESVEEEGGEACNSDQSQHVLHSAHLHAPPPLPSLGADGRGDQTSLKTASSPQLPLPHQESATGVETQGDKQGKWQVFAADEKSAMDAEPQRGAKTTDNAAEKPDVTDSTEGSQREIDLKHNDADVARRPEPLKDDEISNMSASQSDISTSRPQLNPRTIPNTTAISVDKTGSYTTGSKPISGHNEISMESSYLDDSLDRTLRAAASEPVETSASLSQKQQSVRSATKTLTSSDADAARSVQKTHGVVTEAFTSQKESQQDWRTETKVGDGDSRKGENSHSSSQAEPTMAWKSTYARSHSLDKQSREGVGFAEHHLASFYSSQTAAAAAELRMGFTDNEISNDAIFEIQSDLVPGKKKKTPLSEQEHKTENMKPSRVTPVNASVLSSGSQHLEVREQSIEDVAHDQHWGEQISVDEDFTMDDDYGIENPNSSKTTSRDSPPSLFTIDSDIPSLDVFRDKGALNSPSPRPSLQSSLVPRVNRLEQVLDEVKQITSEGQRTLESRLDRLEGMVEKLLQMMRTQKKDTPTTPSGSGPSSLQGDVHNAASGGEHSLDMEQPLERADSSPEPNKTRSTSYKGKNSDRKVAFQEEPPSYRQHGKAGKTRRAEFLSPEEALPPLRTMESFKGDACVRPKKRPLASRHHEDADKDRKGTKGVHTETTKGKKGVPAETRDTYGDTRRQEAGTAGQDGGIRVYAGELRQGSGGRGGTKTEEAELEDEYLEVSTRPKKPARKEYSRTLRPQSAPLDAVDERASTSTSGENPLPFSSDTLMFMERLMVVTMRSEITIDPAAFRLATALETAIHPGIDPMPPRAIARCTLLVLDNSESMKGKPLQQVLQFASTFLDKIEDIAEQHSTEENIGIITIGGGTKVIHHLTNDYNSLRSALEGIRAEGRTPLFEAMLVCFGIGFTQHTTVYVADTLTIKTRVIFVTDGKITDETEPHGPDTPATNPEVKRELIRLQYSMQRAPIFPKPIIWVPAGDVDKAFMDSMAKVPLNGVLDMKDIDYLTNDYRFQITTGMVMASIMDLPEIPLNITESIRSHIEVFQPDISEEYKNIIFTRVARYLTRHYAGIALGLDKRTGDHHPSRHPDSTTAPRQGQSQPHTTRGQKKAAH